MNKILSYMYNDGIDYTLEDYNIEDTKTILEEHEKSLYKIYRDLEDSDYNTEDVYNLGDIINLVIRLKEELK